MRLHYIDPARLDALARGELVRELYALHSQIFDGVSLVQFRRQVFDGAGAYRTRLVVARAWGDAVAYSAVHVCEAELAGSRVALVRAEAGALPAYRGRLFMWGLWARELLRAALVHGRAPWYLGTFVHPSAYVALGRLVDVLPRSGHPLPSDLLSELETAAELRTEGLVPGLAHVGWKTREQGTHRRARESDLARFFTYANPDYRDGVGLVVAHRFTLRSLARGVWRALSRRLRRRTARP